MPIGAIDASDRGDECGVGSPLVALALWVTQGLGMVEISGAGKIKLPNRRRTLRRGPARLTLKLSEQRKFSVVTPFGE